jgi:hypothetical protein
VWIGSVLDGIDGLAAGDPVTAEQMRALFGCGLHPLAQLRQQQLAGPALSPRDYQDAARLGAPFEIIDGVVSPFRLELARRFAAINTAAGFPAGTPLPATERARVRTEVARELFLAPTAAAASSHYPTRNLTIDITIRAGTLSPSGHKLDVNWGDTIASQIDSDQDDTIHVHTADRGYTVKVHAGQLAAGNSPLRRSAASTSSPTNSTRSSSFSTCANCRRSLPDRWATSLPPVQRRLARYCQVPTAARAAAACSRRPRHAAQYSSHGWSGASVGGRAG